VADIFGAPAVAPAPPADPFDAPAAAEPTPPPAPAFIPGSRTFTSSLPMTVQEGETLRQVASRAGVDPGDLFNANRGVIGSSPSSIRPGMVLAVPED
jgi:hypothetical protein